MTIILEYAPMPGPVQVEAITLRVDEPINPVDALAHALTFAGAVTSIPVRAIRIEIPPEAKR